MKKNLFEMGANFEEGWSSDNQDNTQASDSSIEIRTPKQHQLHFAKERRMGKIVTIVQPFYLEKADLQALLKKLKTIVGTGGTLKENRLEFQGDINETLRSYLQKLDFGMKHYEN